MFGTLRKVIYGLFIAIPCCSSQSVISRFIYYTLHSMFYCVSDFTEHMVQLYVELLDYQVLLLINFICMYVICMKTCSIAQRPLFNGQVMTIYRTHPVGVLI